MNTIYTNSADRKAYLDVPVTPTDNTAEVTILDGDSVVYSTDSPQVEDDGRLSVTVPFSLTQSDKDYEVHWTFDYTEDSQSYAYDNYQPLSVVTPILPMREINQILGEGSTTEEATKVERAVRYVIQAHTGQFFGKFIGKKSVTGSGDSHLRLPMRLITLNNINGSTYWNTQISVRGAGWFLRTKNFGVPTIRADFDGWHEDPWGYSGRSPIVAPYSRATFGFIENAEYEIDGVWGWESVPPPVQEAARLLINDYACEDSMYRDRFVSAMTAADWRIQFHEGAFSDTGNVRANQLLSEYVLRRGWAVV